MGDGMLQVLAAMAWRSSRARVVVSKSIVSLANWRPMIASPVDPACATPL